MPHGEPSPFRESVLFEAIPVRHTNRKVYEELGYWIGQGVFGTPWLLAKIGQLAVTYMNIGRGQAKKDSEVLMSAPVLAVLSSEVNDRFWCRKNEDFICIGKMEGKIFGRGRSSLSRKLLR